MRQHAAAAAEQEDTPDPLGEQIVAAGLARNAFLLGLDNALSVPDGFALPAPWILPSRMFAFPIETHAPENGQPRTIGLMHPMLAEHPFVKHVEAVLGLTIPREAAHNAYGYTQSDTAQWWHAVDLVSAGHWRELIETAHFTTPDAMLRAVEHGLRYSGDGKRRAHDGYLTVREARALLAWLRADEPANRAASVRELGTPDVCRDDKGNERYPVNSGGADSTAEAWAYVHGIEDGWLIYDRAGFLQWSELGRARYAARDDGPVIDASGQSAFAF